jgi:ribosomal protein S18 acetylase RimI-like enzyme
MPPRKVADELVISSEPEAGAAVVEVVRRGLYAFNARATGLEEPQPVRLLARDGGGEVRGGLLGALWGDWLHLTHLWIDEPFRGRGFGRRLVEAAEQSAAEAGAQGCFLSTFDFQAPGFYRRLGYEVYGELVDYPPGHTTYHFRKWLPRR